MHALSGPGSALGTSRPVETVSPDLPALSAARLCLDAAFASLSGRDRSRFLIPHSTVSRDQHRAWCFMELSATCLQAAEIVLGGTGERPSGKARQARFEEQYFVGLPGRTHESLVRVAAGRGLTQRQMASLLLDYAMEQLDAGRIRLVEPGGEWNGEEKPDAASAASPASQQAGASMSRNAEGGAA